MSTVTATTPTGSLTLGNLLGALAPAAAESGRAYHFVADLHALTLPQDPRRLKATTLEVLATLRSLAGPETCLFIQSQVAEHLQLSYLLEAQATTGELLRMTQYKLKQRAGESTRTTLLTYPCLMAADILLYQAEAVPVGQDQLQHLQLTRLLAERFNRDYGKVFTVPEARLQATTAHIGDLQEPRKKMSKSSAPEALGVIRLQDSPETIAKKLKKAVMDSEREVRYAPEEKPGVSNLLSILAACSGTTPEEAAQDYTSYKDLKGATTEAVNSYLKPLQAQVTARLQEPQVLLAEAREQAAEASMVAAKTLRAAQEALGLY